MGRLRAYSRAYSEKVGSNPATGTQYFTPSFQISQKCADEVHKGPPYLTGGPLFIEDVSIEWRHSSFVTTRPFYTNQFSGRMYARLGSATHTPPNTSSLGAEAWRRMRPVGPALNLGQFLVELKDLPRMLKSTSDMLRTYMRGGVNYRPGDAWLNYHFGWKPFFLDLLDILEYQKKLDDRLKQLRRNNGKSMRRRLALRSSKSVTSSTTYYAYSSLQPVIYTQAYADNFQNPSTTSIEYNRQAWASARFRYYIPEIRFSDQQWLLRAQLSGLLPNLDVIWSVTPWSWLIDYFTNIGDVLSNMSQNAAYNVVADYAYVMEHQSHTYTTTGSTHVLLPSGAGRRLTASNKRTYSWKQRVVAHPYGFGVTDDTLNAYQWSILIALGLSRF